MKLPPKTSACLAPMARITDVAFRSLCVKYGAGMTVSELVSANGLIQKQNRSFDLTVRAPNEKYFAIQLFGKEAKNMADAAELVSENSNYIDINLGCPVTKVIKNGMGSALLKKPKQIGKIISAMTDRVNNPITAKIRIGFSQKTINAVKVAKEIEDAGASLLTVHGRTTDQGYTGKANWNVIKKVKEAVDIPVIGNGDITNAQTAIDKRKESGVDYVSIGRAASGNPLLFSKIKNKLQRKKVKEIFPKLRIQSKEGLENPKDLQRDKFKVFKEYMKLSDKYNTSFLHKKLQAQHFTKGIAGASKARATIGSAKTSEKLIEAVKNLCDKA